MVIHSSILKIRLLFGVALGYQSKYMWARKAVSILRKKCNQMNKYILMSFQKANTCSCNLQCNGNKQSCFTPSHLVTSGS